MLLKSEAIGCLMLPVVFAAMMLFVAVGSWSEQSRSGGSLTEVAVVLTVVAVLLNAVVVGVWFRVRSRALEWRCMGYSRGFWSVILWIAYGLGICGGLWMLTVMPA